MLTDSEYVRRGITEFLPRWKANGWRASTGKPVVNRDLWEQLEEVAGYHEVTWIHVRGHSGQPNHERCDSLAVTAARSAKRAAARALIGRGRNKGGAQVADTLNTRFRRGDRRKPASIEIRWAHLRLARFSST